MITTFKVTCNDDEVVVVHSSPEGHIPPLKIVKIDFKLSQKRPNAIFDISSTTFTYDIWTCTDVLGKSFKLKLCIYPQIKIIYIQINFRLEVTKKLFH